MGRAQPVTDPEILAGFARDASVYTGNIEGLFRPADEGEVLEALAYCRETGTPVTPIGMQTSTSGASVPERGAGLSLRGLTGIVDIDTECRRARVRAGTPLGEFKRELLAEAGLWLPVDPTSEDDCGIGGAVATNASGQSTLKYGAMCEWVTGLRVALITGEVLELAAREVEKNAVGAAYGHDPTHLFVGSEGTLGVITEVVLRLLPGRPESRTVLVPYADTRRCLDAIPAWRAHVGPALRSLEWMGASAVRLMRAQPDPLPLPEGTQNLLFADIEWTEDELAARFDAFCAFLSGTGADPDAVIAIETDTQLRTFKRMRHAIPSTTNELGKRMQAEAGGGKVVSDFAVPFPRLGEFVLACQDELRAAGIPDDRWWSYGHIGSGHPHLASVGADAREYAVLRELSHRQAERAASLGGTITAEHGVGKLKRPILRAQVSPAVLRAMRAVKRAFDPDGLLAPGNFFPDG